jgi:clan AA aspartic protease (TIGR02281 family)
VGVVHPGSAPLYALSPPASTQTAREGGRAEHIPLRKHAGVYHVPVEINGVLTLQFVLDSGASDVNIPAEVALTLYRAGTIHPDDFLPGKTYVLADGSTVASERLLLRSLKVGNLEVSNVPASIGPVFSSLLLGQSFLERLGAWGIDSQRAVLFLNSSPRTIYGQ